MFKICYKSKFILSCLILATFMGLELILKLFSINLVKGALSTNIYYSILGLILSIIAILFIQKNRLFNKKLVLDKLNKVLTYLVLVYLILTIIIVQVNKDTSAILTFNFSVILTSAILAFTTALFEETLMRGLLFESLLGYFKKNKYFYSALYSSLIFGLAHLWNLRVENPTAVLQQVFFATVMGILLSIIRIRFNGLQIPILIHFFIDFQKVL